MFSKQQTVEWWLNVLADPGKLQAWLQKLYRTELGGYTDHMSYLGQSGAIDEKTAKTLMHIALDELKHSNVLIDLMDARGVALADPSTVPSSTYWQTVNAEVRNLQQYCAVNHFGEDLAAFRFEVIAERKETPGDIKEALRIILPDEIFHRVTLKKMAGDDAIEQMRTVHERAVQVLKRA